jgi:hypothetical protein
MTQRQINIQWRNAAREAMKLGYRWTPINL